MNSSANDDGLAAELGLNEPQAEAAFHVEGPLLVFAGAGSGKTRVITYRIANLVARHRVAPYRVLAVTFTNKAAGEMRERLQHLLGPGVAADLWVGTFHSICARLLRRHHLAVGLGRDFVIYDDSDQRSVVGRIVKDKQLDDRRWPPRMLLSKIHAWKQEGRRPADVGKSGYVDDVVTAYEAALSSSNACDFDDLLLHVLRLVELPEPSPEPGVDQVAALAGQAIRRQFQHVLVDEFQDTNHVQYRLVSALVREHGNLAVVGDDDQSIYSWRGADVRNIRNFSREFPDAHVVRLEQNYRSSARIVRGALGVIGKSLERVPKNLWTANEDGELIEVSAANDERDEAAQLVGTIEAWMAEGWSRREIAVLYRTHAQSRVLEEAMRSGKLPYRIVGGLKFFDRAEVKDLLAYLRVLVNPKSDVDLLRIINVPARGIGGTTIERLAAVATEQRCSVLEAVRAVVAGDLPQSQIAAAARRKLGVFVAIVDALEALVADGAGPADLAEATLERSGYREALEREDTDESDTRLGNLYELVTSIKDYEEQARAAGEVPTISGFLEKTALVNVGDDAKATDDLITLMTVHAAKGLEFRGVIIAGLEEDLFPLRGRNDEDAPPSPSGRSREEESLEEERRLAYVAITRARERLVLLHAASRTVYGQTRYNRPSRFLRDLPQDDLRQRGGPARAGAVFRALSDAGGGSFSRSSSDRAPFKHPMSLGGGGPIVKAPPAPARADGERFVELDDDAGLRSGMRVRHKRFGEGKVIELLEGPDPKIVANFPGWGTMTILQRFLEVVR
jgi:DNA helicase-2/ATP-dependent DNA helicase PcrA